jgi:RNA polymerase sigma-70 factor (ECF subfamily)
MATVHMAAKQGVSEQTFDDLLAPLLRPAYRLAGALLHDAPTAEDVVQDSALIAWKKLPNLKDTSGVKPWFFRIVANECRNARRGTWLNRVKLGIAPTTTAGSVEEQWTDRADLRRALLRLSHEDRLAISLYFYLDMPVPEIAAVMQTSVDATRQRLHRAVRRLRPDLEIEEALR